MRAALILAAGLALAACATQAPPPPADPGAAPPGFPWSDYRDTDGTVYAVDPVASSLQLKVFRAGRLARLGHNHVIDVRALGGRLLLDQDPALARADLYFPVAAMVVDDPGSRAAAGERFASELTDADIAGTRSNMLGEKVLDGANFPFVEVQLRGLSGELPQVTAELRLLVRGQAAARRLPVLVQRQTCLIRASGETSLSQSELSLTPFSVLGGALQVQDEFEVVFSIAARQLSPACGTG